MVPHLILTLVGLAVLLVGGDLLVRGAVGLATALKMPAIFISLTIIAFGTSAPELFVAVASVLEQAPGIAIGNILGSTIANVLLVLGLPALIYPMSAQTPGLARHGLALCLATAAFGAIAYLSGGLDRAWGAALLAGIVLYVVFLAATERRAASPDPVIDDVAEYSGGAKASGGAAALFLIAGLIGLPVGAHLVIGGVSSLAAAADATPELIGLTVVAMGTSLPELATIAAAALRQRSDVAIGNVVGSNVFNLLAVGGAAGIAGAGDFSRAALTLEIPVMAASSLLLAIFIFARRDIGRLAGLMMIASYAAFIAAAAMLES